MLRVTWRFATESTGGMLGRSEYFSKRAASSGVRGIFELPSILRWKYSALPSRWKAAGVMESASPRRMPSVRARSRKTRVY